MVTVGVGDKVRTPLTVVMPLVCVSFVASEAITAFPMVRVLPVLIQHW